MPFGGRTLTSRVIGTKCNCSELLTCSLNAAFKQIGNAVPPLMAYSVAMAMRSMIGCQEISDIRRDILRLKKKTLVTTTGRNGE